MTANFDEIQGAELIDRAMKEDDEAVRDAAIARIEDKARAVKRAMDAGVAPAEFKRLETVHSALEASGKVIEVLWPVAKAKRNNGE